MPNQNWTTVDEDFICKDLQLLHTVCEDTIYSKCEFTHEFYNYHCKIWVGSWLMKQLTVKKCFLVESDIHIASKAKCFKAHIVPTFVDILQKMNLSTAQHKLPWRKVSVYSKYIIHFLFNFRLFHIYTVPLLRQCNHQPNNIYLQCVMGYIIGIIRNRNENAVC